MRKIHMCGLLGAVLLLAGCLMGPNYKQPELDLPTGQAADNFSIFTNAQWWTVFDDEVLNQLETEALAYNKDLQAAVARVDEARAAVGIATADQLPSLSAAAQSGRAGSKAGSGESQSTANVSVSFELDLWGKYRRYWFKSRLPISFQFHHVQMDEGHAAAFLDSLQQVIRGF